MYCNDHMLQANALYAQYKAANAVALATFSDDALDQAIALRQEYARRFLDYEDTGAHSAYIGILQRVRSIAVASSVLAPSVAVASSSVLAPSVAAASSSVLAPSVAAASSSVLAPSVAAAYRRTAYNRWMTESAYFSDFKRVVGLRSVAVGNL
jgi:uncharacterized membrane protein YcgQ (UPF0703/DUF1980 family)